MDMESSSSRRRQRGIQNVSGVACHLSCALQLVLRTILPLQEALLHLASCDILDDGNDDNGYSSSIHCDLAKLCQELLVVATTDDNDNNHNGPLDPTKFYRKCSKLLKINEQDVGDASTAVIRLLQHLASSKKEGSCWKQLLDVTVYGSQTRQVLVGKKPSVEDQSSTTVVRTKRGNLKNMGVPYVVRGRFETLEEGLERSFQAQCIEGYNWDRPEQVYEEEKIIRSIDVVVNGKGYDDSWITHKTIEWHNVSPYWLVQLERFGYEEGERILVNGHIAVPERIDLRRYMINVDNDPNTFLEYDLLGGICHVAEGSMEEEGHYVTLLRSSTVSNQEWTLYNDEIFTEISIETALSYLSGSRDEKGQYFCGILLIFGSSRSSSAMEDSLAVLKDQINDQAKHAAERRGWTDPYEVIGRKLRVRWAKGKFYPGEIVSYDAATGKHRVKYDDGDEKEYTLAKKTIEWLE